MSKKILALNISLLMLLSTTLPGSLAFSAMAEEPSEDAEMVSEEIIVAEEELLVEEEIVLEEDVLIEEVAIPSQEEALPDEEVMIIEKVEEDLPLVEEVVELQRNNLYIKLMATKTHEDFDAIMEKTTEAEFSSLSEEEITEIGNHIDGFESEEVFIEIKIVYPTVNFDNVAPLKEPVTGGNNQGGRQQ